MSALDAIHVAIGYAQGADHDQAAEELSALLRASSALSELIEAVRELGGTKQANGVLVSFEAFASLAIAFAAVDGLPGTSL